MAEKIDINAPHLAGKYLVLDETGSEFEFPPAHELVSPWEHAAEAKSAAACASSGCAGKVKVSEQGNTQYAWYYLTNSANGYAGVTIERWWIYQNQWRKDTVRHRLYPGQHKEVFSFPRNQKPMCCIIACNPE